MVDISIALREEGGKEKIEALEEKCLRLPFSIHGLCYSQLHFGCVENTILIGDKSRSFLSYL